MFIHDREMSCMKAKNKLQSAILEMVKEFDLTTGEQISIINNVCHDHLSSIAKYVIRPLNCL